MNFQRLVVWVGLAASSLVGCASTSGADFVYRPEPEMVAAALARSGAPPRAPRNSEGKPMAFALISGGDGLQTIAAIEVKAAKVLWSQKAAVAGRFESGETFMTTSDGDDRLTAYDLQNGTPLWSQDAPRGMRLQGFTMDGDDVFAVYTSLKAAPSAHSELRAFSGRGGRKRFSIRLADRVGAPAARGGIVAVPQRSQFVTLFDAANGKPLGDILSREEAAAFVKALPEGLFFGSQGIFLASEDTALGSRKSDGYLHAKLPAWVQGAYHRDTYKPQQNRFTALDRNRLLWRVHTGNGPPMFEDGLLIVHHFRFMFAIEVATGNLRWAYSHPRVDMVTAVHAGPSVVFLDADGHVGALEAKSGRLLSLQAVAGMPSGAIQGVAFDVEGHKDSGPGAAPAAGLVEVLRSVALDPDRRFSDVRVFAVDRLSHLKVPGVSAALLDIVENGSDHDLVVQKASESLVDLRDPAALDIYLRAIKVVPDYASGKKAKRLDLMARALSKLGAREAVPLLCAHLRWPDTDPAVVPDIANAALALKVREAVPAFRDYLSMYRADPDFESRPDALVAAAQVLAELGTVADKEWLLFLADHGLTNQSLASAIGRLMEGE